MSGDAPDIFPSISANAIGWRLILGSKPQSITDLDKLRSAFLVTDILNVCEVDDAQLWGAARPAWLNNYLFNPTADDGGLKPAAWFQNSLRFVMPILVKPGGVIYVHCESGMDRSAATVYAILRAVGLERDDAWLLIKRHRPEALWRYMADCEAMLSQGW